MPSVRLVVELTRMNLASEYGPSSRELIEFEDLLNRIQPAKWKAEPNVTQIGVATFHEYGGNAFLGSYSFSRFVSTGVSAST